MVMKISDAAPGTSGTGGSHGGASGGSGMSGGQGSAGSDPGGAYGGGINSSVSQIAEVMLPPGGPGVPGTSTGGPSGSFDPPNAGAGGNHAPKPKGNHKGGTEGGTDPALLALLEAQMAMFEMFMNQSQNPNQGGKDGGYGFEDTVLTRRVLGEDELYRPSIYGIQRQVIDPITGAVYSSPQAALAAGVSNWQYAPVPGSRQTPAAIPQLA